jgi:hypothetical protein
MSFFATLQDAYAADPSYAPLFGEPGSQTVFVNGLGSYVNTLITEGYTPQEIAAFLPTTVERIIFGLAKCRSATDAA